MSSSGKKNLKQGNLFSFFSKKPAATKTPTQSQSTPAAASTSASSSSASESASKSNTLWQQVTVGARVEVYWPNDKTYYAAKVTEHSKDSFFTLTYEDGEVERVDLATETFRILKETGPPSKKRRIHEDSEEEEFELEDTEEEAGDDESAYEQDDAAEPEDDEDEIGQWMVTDDENSAEKKQKQKPRFQVTQVKPAAAVAAKKKSNFATPMRPKGLTTTATPKTTVTPPESRGMTTTPSAKAIKGALNPGGSHVHNHLKFLRNPKDSKGRTTDDPNYDPHTLKVDYSELKRLKELTPAMEQWWAIKAQYYDTVLLFKTGKFYELYHMDADVGVNVLDFCYMKGHVAHAGFPEISYGVMAERLVQAGYKVARVEQTETPDMLKERKKNKRKGVPTPKVVNREVCSILTRGTRTFCYLDDTKDLASTSESSPIGPLLAIREVLLETNDAASENELHPVCEYGVTLLDAVRGTVTIGQFADDVLRSRMNTLLSTFEPSEILIEGGENGASPVLQSLIRSVQVTSNRSMGVEKIQPTETFPKSTATDSDVRRKMERKSPTAHPWDVKETLEEVHRRGYYPRASRQNDEVNTSRWPKVLQAAVEGKAELALSSFGAIVFYLQRNLIDYEMLCMGLVKGYVPPSSSGTAKQSSVQELTEIVTQQEQQEDGVEAAQAAPTQNADTPAPMQVEFECPEEVLREKDINHMAMDGTTLQNLEVLCNSQTYTASGSLWSKINYTKTPHGFRLLRAWLLRPLFRKADIERRADAVEELVSGGAAVAMAEARSILSKCGDIERLLSRVHSMGGSGSSSEEGHSQHHPNERAVLYEGATHTKRKVNDFQKVLQSLRHTSQIPELFAGVEIRSGLVEKLVRLIDDGGCFPEMTDKLDWFFDNFNCEQAAQGLFEPSRGVNEDYDDACDAIERIKSELGDYKDEMCRELPNSSLARSKWKYINTKVDSKDKYLIELPASIQVPEDFLLKGKRGSGAKQVNKYRTPVIEEMVQELERAYDVQKEGKERGMQLIFAKFDSMRHVWAAAAQATAMLDALGSLAQASTKAGYVRPTILDCPPDGEPRIRVVQGKHPCVETTHSGGDFIPNDLALGEQSSESGEETDASRVLLLSGPNMGGKSTLLRQTCLIAILAQVGCYVPAEECALTPIDRIYTRLGASDRILQGQSTFFVELAETASALRGATRRSLVIMDELGRGTSTHDGTAIASACVKHLVQRNRSLTLFATHYHSLLDEWKDDPMVRLGHMKCLVEGSEPLAANDEMEEAEEPQGATNNNITFLYILGDGSCPKSFGINVARLAGLHEDILKDAKRVSSSFEAELKGVDDVDSSMNDESLALDVKKAFDSGDMNEVKRLWSSI